MTRFGAARGPLVALFFSLFETLQGLIRTHREELEHHILYAQAAFQFLHGLRTGGELQQHIRAFAVLIHAVRQPALSPLIYFVDGCSGLGQLGPQLLYELIDFFFRLIRLHDEQLFVNSHASSLFEPGARRLNFVMAFSTPSAIIEPTASAA